MRPCSTLALGMLDILVVACSGSWSGCALRGDMTGCQFFFAGTCLLFFLPRDILVCLCSSYWISCDFFSSISSLDLLLLLRDWRSGRTCSKLAAALPLKLGPRVHVCLFLCVQSCRRRAHSSSSSCNQSVSAAQPAAVALCG